MMLAIFVAALVFLKSAFAADLDDYVWREDSHYNWKYMGPEFDLHGTDATKKHSWTGYILNVTSLKWLNDEDFSPSSEAKSVWWHYLVVIVPDKINYLNNGTLWITGGGMGGPPSADSEDVFLTAALAMGMGTITGAFFQIPNEHITFASDPIQKSRTEDAIIAFTWDHFLKDPSNPEWLVRFPMVKASLRAMDAMTDFVNTNLPELNCNLESYVVAGASKRGWTTWLVGAVDPVRVKAIAPIVLDAINFVAVEHHEWKSYNGWTWALADYLEMDIMSRLDIPEMLLLQQQEDPYFFKDRLTMPKLVINAVLDEFQHPDDTHYWWNDMPEPKHFLMVPNAEHSEITGILEVVPAIGTWATYLLNQWKVPEFTWTISDTTGEIVATLDDLSEVYEASVWYAYSCGTNADGVKRRDFRIVNVDAPCRCGIPYEGYCGNLKSFWTREVLEGEVNGEGKRVFRAKIDAPEDGRYVAYLIDIKYKEPDAHPYFPSVKPVPSRDHRGNILLPIDKPGRLEFTTEVSIWPNTFPFEDCSGSSCAAVIV